MKYINFAENTTLTKTSHPARDKLLACQFGSVSWITSIKFLYNCLDIPLFDSGNSNYFSGKSEYLHPMISLNCCTLCNSIDVTNNSDFWIFICSPDNSPEIFIIYLKIMLKVLIKMKVGQETLSLIKKNFKRRIVNL
jgi:hypothetical protein